MASTVASAGFNSKRVEAPVEAIYGASLQKDIQVKSMV
jgi:hypothetical protein